MAEPWLPESGSITALRDARLAVHRAGEEQAHLITVSGHRCTVSQLDEVPADAVVLPAERYAAPLRYADGRLVPPFDETEILAGLPEVQRATMVGQLVFEESPFRGSGFQYWFRDGRLEQMRLVPDGGGSAAPGQPAPEGLNLIWRADWARWCLWRTGQISGEQFLEGASIQASWPYIALAQGLMEHDKFVEERRRLPVPSGDLLLLRLVDW